MHMLLAVLAVSSQSLYAAHVNTFACNSAGDVSELRQARGNAEEFQTLLLQKFVYGACLQIGAGTVVEGAADKNDKTMLQVQTTQDPPGYLVPAEDFKEAQAAKPEANTPDVASPEPAKPEAAKP
jgi:hypothetical protein